MLWKCQLNMIIHYVKDSQVGDEELHMSISQGSTDHKKSPTSLWLKAVSCVNAWEWLGATHTSQKNHVDSQAMTEWTK